jgi:glycine betaine/proline transport system substrate-binding protein
MKASRKILAIILALVVSVLVAGCGGGGALGSNQLKLGSIGWDENTVVSNLTKIALEDDLGYSKVELQQADVGPTFQGVGSGELDAFQDVWLPNHQAYLDDPNVKDNVEQLPVWYQDTTQFGLAVPTYTNITSIDQLADRTDISEILGIEPGAVITNQINDHVIPDYSLPQSQKNSATATMLSEVDRRYKDGEDFVFVAWRPHKMNQDYSLRYLKDPKESLGVLGKESSVLSIAHKGLENDHPDAYEFMRNISLDENQIVDMEREVDSAGDPEQGVRNWLNKDNNKSNIVQPWIDAAKKQQS